MAATSVSIRDMIVEKLKKIELLIEMLAQQNRSISQECTEEKLRNYQRDQESLKTEQKELNDLQALFIKQLKEENNEKDERNVVKTEEVKKEDEKEIPLTSCLNVNEVEEVEVTQLVELIDQLTVDEEAHQKAAKELVFLSHLIDKRNFISLIDSGLKINKKFSRKNDEDITPLGFACETQNSRLIKLLLENSADPNITATENLTPLEMCLINSFETDITIDCVRVLAEYGVKFDISPEIQDCCEELFRIIITKLSK